MTTLDNLITGFVAGDAFDVRRTITSVPSGQALEKAWMTVKAQQTDADAAATTQKEITTSNVAGTGQIEDDGSGDQSGVVRFDFTKTDTAGWTPETLYFYDIQVEPDGTKEPYTVETGFILPRRGFTDASGS